MRSAATHLSSARTHPGAAPLGREYSFSHRDFERVRRLIHARAGINLNPSKADMVYSRLSRRLRATGHGSFQRYLDSLESGADREAGEWQEFTNALTTNLTSFFREPHHFSALADYIASRGRRPLRIWCAAASTGEEPWSIAMVACEAYGTHTPPVEIVATDIDTNVLADAARAVYREEALRNIDDRRRRRFFQRGMGGHAGLARIRPEIAALVRFEPLNLLSPHWPIDGRFDLIFCRNVLIYFDKPTQHGLLRRMAAHLDPGGLLFVGHSENFTDQREHFRLRGKTIYERVDATVGTLHA